MFYQAAWLAATEMPFISQPSDMSRTISPEKPPMNIALPGASSVVQVDSGDLTGRIGKMSRGGVVMDLTQSWIITGTLTVFGFGLGLLIGAGKTPRRLYVVGAIVTLLAAALYGAEFYLFFLGPAMQTVGGSG